MSRKVVRITLDHLAAFDPPCRTCLFWEYDPVRRSRVGDPRAGKDGWVSEVLREWGSCGRVVLVDDEPVGLALYAPEAFLPGAAGMATAPVSTDAVLLTTVYVDPRHRGGGLGRMLVQGVARDLVDRRISAVEAFGHHGRREDRCLLPVDFLGGVGFHTQRPHPVTPRLRMDLRTALTWRDEVESALVRLLGVVRPVPKSTRGPASKATRASRVDAGAAQAR